MSRKTKNQKGKEIVQYVELNQKATASDLAEIGIPYNSAKKYLNLIQIIQSSPFFIVNSENKTIRMARERKDLAHYLSHVIKEMKRIVKNCEPLSPNEKQDLGRVIPALDEIRDSLLSPTP